MNISKILSVLTIMSLAASCTIAEPDGAELSLAALQQELTLTATFGEPETRTERASDGSVLWSPGDEISLFYGSGSAGGSRFTAQNTETAKTVNFTGTIGVITGGNNIAVEDTYFWAVYPYDAAASCDGSSITTMLPSVQTATAGTFADDLFPSMGRSQGLNMSFYNICGGIKFTVSEEGIKSVTLKSNSGEPIAGTISAAFDNGVPVVTGVAGGSDSITLQAPAGGTFETGQAYYFVMVPTVFETGFTLTFSKGYARAERTITSRATIKRSVFGTMNTPDAGLEWETLYVPIPDANFKAYMIQNFDTNGNGELDFDEAEAVTRISVNTDNIESLEGIKYCRNLEYLGCSGTKANWSSTEQRYIGTGQLSKLDVCQNTALTSLYCYSNQLTSLDVSQNTALQTLHCNYNQLTSLDLSKNTALQSLYCYFNQLTSLDVSKNTALAELYCYSNQLTSLDVSKNTALTSLYCDRNQLTSLDVSKNTALAYLDCYSNQLTSLDVSKNTALAYLYCYSNQLTSMDVSQNTALVVLYCYSNQLTSLDVSQNTALQSLECSSNQLTSLDVSQNTELKYLYCSSNQLTSLEVSNNTALTYLDCSPMNASNGQNLLGYLYIAQGQSIPNVTTDRNSSYVPSETIIMVAPEPGVDENIIFTDAEVKRLCVAAWDTNKDGELSIGEAQAVTSIGTVFKGNTQIQSFDELKYFTRLMGLDAEAFSSCTSLSSITLPESITSIGPRAFARCTQLSSFSGKFASDDGHLLIVDKTVVASAPAALSGSYSIPSTVSTVGEYAYYGCSGLRSIEIPEKVTAIGQYAFSYCTGLSSIEMSGTTPPSGGSYMFGNTNNCPIYVPSVSVNAYKATAGWSAYADRIFGIDVSGTVVGPEPQNPD